MRHSLSTFGVLISLAAALAGCASMREARMAQAPSVASLSVESFGQVGWGRRGEFMLGGQVVRYERSADKLSLFDAVNVGRAPLKYTWVTPAGASQADCSARQAELTLGSMATATRPWTMSCRWTGASNATLQIGEGRVQRGQQVREGSYQRGELTLGLRSVHLLDGSSIPTAAAVGYEMVREGQVVGSLDLSSGTPRLRRPDPRTPLGQAVTEAALALALVWEPS